ncbi:MAG: PAS domain S-box protein [Halanaeroarchaeum sp.]
MSGRGADGEDPTGGKVSGSDDDGSGWSRGTPIVQFRLDSRGNVSSWNRVAADLLGYEATDVIGTPLEELLGDPVGEAWVEEALDRTKRTGQIAEMICHTHRDGTTLEGRVSLAVARGGDGECTGYLYGFRPIEGVETPEEDVDRRHGWLETSFEKSPDSIFVHDADGEILQVNLQTVEDLGYSRTELLSMKIGDIDVGFDIEDLRELWEQMETGRREKLETEHRRKDGTTFPVEIWLTKLCVEGEPQFLALGRDITDKKERERELEKLTERYEFAIEAANLAVWDWDLRTDEVQFNDNWATMLGLDPAEVESSYDEWERRVHPDDIDDVLRALEMHIAGETEYYETEHRMKTESGDWKWIRDIGEVYERDDRGEPVRAVGIHIDIDDRKRAERALREERDSLQSIIESLPYPFYVLDVEDYSVEYVNSQADVQVGETCFERTHGRDRPCDEGEDGVACPIRDIRATKEPTIVEHAHRDDAGEQRIYEVYASPIYDDEGAVEWVAESAIEVTERHEYARQLENQRDRLERIRNVTEGIRPLNRALARASSREEIISLVCEKLVETDMYRFAWFGEYDPLAERVTPEAWAGAEEGYLDEVELVVDAPDTVRGPVDRAIRSQAVHTSQNIATDPAFEPWRDPALERGFKSTAAIPIVMEGNIHGVLSVYSNRSNAFETYERELLGELGERVGHAIQAADRRQLLHGEAARELVFRIEDEHSPFVDVSQRLDCQLELESIIPATGASYIGYMTVDGTPPESVVDVLEHDDCLESARVISANGDAGRFEYVVSTSPGTKLLEYDVSITAALIDDGEEIIHGEVAPETSVQPIVAGLRSAYDDVELIAKRSVDRSARTPRGLGETIDDALTTRQREVLSLAYQAGYFESPRQSTGEELAETIGIASATFYVLVRRGMSNVLDQLDEFKVLE